MRLILRRYLRGPKIWTASVADEQFPRTNVLAAVLVRPIPKAALTKSTLFKVLVIVHMTTLKFRDERSMSQLCYS